MAKLDQVPGGARGGRLIVDGDASAPAVLGPTAITVGSLRRRATARAG